MSRISSCLLVVALIGPVGCAEMNPFSSSSNKFPEPMVPPGSLEPVSTSEVPLPSRPTDFEPYQGVPGGLEPSAGAAGPEFGSAGAGIRPEDVNSNWDQETFDKFRAELETAQSSTRGGFASSRD